MNFTINPEKIDESFDQLAAELMNNYAIQVKDSYYRIVDCEFYFKHELHSDIYVHEHEEQTKNGSWYFHGSGIDITMGNETIGAVGGILLRGIAKLTNDRNPNGDYIEVNKKTIGPLNVLTTLFSHFTNVFDSNNSFRLVEKESIKGVELAVTDTYKVPRVGLNKSIDTDKFHDKPYRYITFPYLPHRDKEKIQTYLRNTGTLDDDTLKKLFTLQY